MKINVFLLFFNVSFCRNFPKSYTFSINHIRETNKPGKLKQFFFVHFFKFFLRGFASFLSVSNIGDGKNVSLFSWSLVEKFLFSPIRMHFCGFFIKFFLQAISCGKTVLPQAYAQASQFGYDWVGLGLNYRLIDWLIGCLVGWMDGWLVGWPVRLVEWPIENQFMFPFLWRPQEWHEIAICVCARLSTSIPVAKTTFVLCVLNDQETVRPTDRRAIVSVCLVQTGYYVSIHWAIIFWFNFSIPVFVKLILGCPPTGRPNDQSSPHRPTPGIGGSENECVIDRWRLRARKQLDQTRLRALIIVIVSLMMDWRLHSKTMSFSRLPQQQLCQSHSSANQ